MNKTFPYQSAYSDQEIVLHHDDRIPVNDYRQAPFSWICSIEVEFPEPVIYPLGTLEHPGKNWSTLTPSRQGCGSGLLISPRHVLTASHVIGGLKRVYKKGKAVFQVVKAQKVKVIPGRNEQSRIQARPYGLYYGKEVHISPGFKKTIEVPVDQLSTQRVRQALSHDFGLINLRDSPIAEGGIFPGLKAGWWSEEINFQIKPAEKVLSVYGVKPLIRVAGYPGEKGPGPCTTPWYAKNKLVQILPSLNHRKENLIFYNADTSAGMSGSPVWIKNKEGRHYLVAVHSSFLKIRRGGNLQEVNVGTLLSTPVIRQLKQWGVTYQEVIFSKPFR